MNSSKKVVIVGDAGVGKTRLAHELMDISFEKYEATIGVEVHTYRVDGAVFNLWDMAGNENYTGCRDGYYSSANAFVIVCDNQEQEDKWRSKIPSDVPILVHNPQADTTLSLTQRLQSL